MINIFLFYFFPIILLMLSGVCLALVAWGCMLAFGIKRDTRLNIFILITAIFLGLSVAEEALRITGTFANYMEQKSQSHLSWSPYDCDHKNVLWKLIPFQKYNLQSDEFNYPRTANSLGFDDKEFTTSKDSNEVKILCLGDSFTEGDGCPFDSSYPYQMSRILQARYPAKKITVMNAGMCGSDPIFGYRDYDSILYHFSPDIVIQSMAEQDFYEDIALRGGFDRFTPNDELYYPNPYKYEKLYKWSFLSRIYFVKIKHLNMFFLNQQIVNNKGPYFKEVVCQLARKWDQQIAKHNFKMYFVLRPDGTDINNHQYNMPFSEVVNELKVCSKRASIVDLNPFYIDSVHMDKDVMNYFWRGDGHHNSSGYYEMARGTADAIKW